MMDAHQFSRSINQAEPTGGKIEPRFFVAGIDGSLCKLAAFICISEANLDALSVVT
jgi:hypothetical protein